MSYFYGMLFAFRYFGNFGSITLIKVNSNKEASLTNSVSFRNAYYSARYLKTTTFEK